MTEPATTTPDTQAQEEAPAALPAQPEQQNQNDLPQWARDAITKANKEAANYRTQVADLKPQADQFRQLEEASKSDAQRLQEQAATAERERDESRSEALRLRVALKHGIGESDFDLLGSGTEEQINTRAERVAQLNAAATAAAATTKPPNGRPVEKMRPGATPGEAESEEDVVYARLFGADH